MRRGVGEKKKAKIPITPTQEQGGEGSSWSYFINRHKTRTSVLSFTLKKTNLYILKRD